MRITDIIRGILDQVDQTVAQKTQETPPVEIVSVQPATPADFEATEEPEQGLDLVSIIKQLAGVPTNTEPNHVNAPDECIAPLGAAFPKGDDMHHSKNPADIRTNAPSMYPNYQAK